MPQVFVSAATAELGSYRLAVRDKLLKLGVHPIVQDDFPPDYRSVVDMLRKRIGPCDAVICLIGQCYGSEPSQRADVEPRRSYTQLEYDIAIELSKPVFTFLATADCPPDKPLDGRQQELKPLQDEYVARIKGGDQLWYEFASCEKLVEQVAVIRFDPEALKGVIPRQTVVLVAELADMCGQLARLGEEAWSRTVARPYHELLHDVLARFHGELRLQTEDACVVTFDSISHAVSAALALDRSIADREWQLAPPGVRLAIHQGQIAQFPGIQEKHVLIAGHTLRLCRRLAGLGVPRQTLLTGVAFDEARARAGDLTLEEGLPLSDLRWESYGRYLLLPGDEPLEVREVGVAGRSPLRAPADSALARRADSAEEQKMRGWRPSLGQEVPRAAGWVIQKKLGEGGFGEVWLARKADLAEPRVFKFCFDPERLRSFKRELAFFNLLTVRLGKRDDIARLYDVSVDEPPFYLVSEYVESGDLEQWAERQGGLAKVPLARRLALLARVARTVAAAHSLGIIHKDIKPSNIFIVEHDGELRPRLADFGIGVLSDRALVDRYGMKGTDFFKSVVAGNESSRTGTRLYSPPEALTGAPATTARDVYALGVMLYQMVVGDLHRPLGVGFEEEIGDEVLLGDVTAATHQDPARRLGAAALLAERLETLDARRDELQKRRRAELAAARMQRLRAWLAAAVVALAVVGGLGAVAGLQWLRAEGATRAEQQAKNDALALADKNKQLADEERAARQEAEKQEARAVAGEKRAKQQTTIAEQQTKVAEQQTQAANEERTAALRAKQEAERQRKAAQTTVYFNNIALAERAWMQNNLGAAQRHLEECPLDLRAWEWDYVHRLCYAELLAAPQPQRVSSVAFSPDGDSIAAALAAEDGQGGVQILDALTGKLKRAFAPHDGPVGELAFSPRGDLIASACSARNEIKLWDPATGDVRHTFRMREASALAFSSDGKLLAGGGDVNQTGGAERAPIEIWNVHSGKEEFSLPGPASPIKSLAFSPDGKKLVSGGGYLKQGEVKVWDLAQRKEAVDFKGHSSSVFTVAFSPDGRRVASGDYDHKVLLWDPNNGAVLLSLPEHDSLVSCVAFQPTDKDPLLATASWDQTLRIWDTRTGHNKLTLRAHVEPISSVAFDRQGLRLVSGSWDRTVKVWNVDDPNEPITGRVEALLWVKGLAFHRRGRRLAVAYGIGGDVVIWQPRMGVPYGSVAGQDCVAYSLDGKWLATAENEDKGETRERPLVKIFGAENREEKISLSGHRNRITAVAFSSDQRLLASASLDGTARLWDFTSGNELASLDKHEAGVTTLAFTPDGKRLVTGSFDRTVKLWNVADGSELRTWKGHPNAITQVAVSRDGRLLGVGCGEYNVPGEIWIWKIDEQAQPLQLRGHQNWVTCIDFHPDGRRIASGSYDKTVKLWDLSSGLEAISLMGYAHQVTALQFSADGHRLATGSWDGSIKIWDASPKEEFPAEDP
jgi:WD40 repeat protein